MRNFITLVAAFWATQVPGAQAGEQQRWPKGPDELQVGLHVLYALEEGPVVCKIVLKNVGNAVLKYSSSKFSPGPFCTVDAPWRAKKEPLFQVFGVLGSIGPYIHSLKPGETRSAIFHLHKNYLAVPAGKATIHFGWNVYRCDEKRELETMFVLKTSQAIDIHPATKENVTAALSLLEKRVAGLAERVKGGRDYSVWFEDESEGLVATLRDCRHKEFVPLLLRTIDALPQNSFRKPIRTVYESLDNPQLGFEALIGYLSLPHPAAANDVFEYWCAEDREHFWSKQRQEVLKKKGPRKKGPPTEEESLQELLLYRDGHDEEVWRNSRRHLDTRLTSKQFARLRTIPNPWIRALLYSHYPKECPDEWVKVLLRDLEQGVQLPWQLEEWIGQLDDPSFRVREEATARIGAVDPIWVATLQGMSKKAKSLEVARRLQLIASKLGNPPLPRLFGRTIIHLSWNAEPQNQKMLEVLTDSTSHFPNHISFAAREAVAAQEKKLNEDRARKERLERTPQQK